MRRIALLIAPLLLICRLAAPAAAAEDKLLTATIKQIETAFLSEDWQLVRGALWRAKRIRDRYNDSTARSLAVAVAKGVMHKNSRIAVAAAETLAELRVPGTTKLIEKMLDPPAEPSLGRHLVHIACIQAIATLHEKQAIHHFEKLLKHPDRDLAVAGAKALAAYWLLDDRPLIALVGRLASALARTDASLAKARAMPRKDRNAAKIKHYQALRDALVESLRKLTDEKKLNTPADCRAWIKKKRKGNA